MIILYAQWDFGVGDKYYRRVPDGYEDTYEEREKWFRQCLDELGKCDQYQSLAFPYKIGCGLAGGNWENYLVMINDFTFKYKKDVTLVKKKCFQRTTYVVCCYFNKICCMWNELVLLFY